MSTDTATTPEIVDKAGAVNMRKVFIKTYGCQMNVYDSVRMGDALASEGYVPTEEMEDADLILLNTCHIREKAAEKVYSALGRLRDMKQARNANGQELMIGVTGCVAQAEGEEILRRAPAVDVVVGPQTYHRLPDALRRARQGTRVVDTDYAVEDKFEHLPATEKARIRARGVTAFLTVQEGCDKFCTYCVVPYTRGAEVSRPFADLMDEAHRLVDAGAKEITLLGQNVNAWDGEDSKGRAIGLDGLIRALANLPDLARIRYTTSHPNDMTDALIEAHGTVAKLMPYLHLPVQSGNDRVLKAMNRSHTAESYLRVLEKVRAARPDIALSGDFIVGFPGETEAEFADTLSLVGSVRYAAAFSFKYSPRPGTPAAEMDDQIAADVMDERLKRLQDAINRDQLAFNNASVGKRIDVLVERKGRHPGQWLGKSPWLQSVHFTGESAIGEIVSVELTEAGPNSMGARLPQEAIT